MTEDGLARVDRLVGWIRRFRKELLDDEGDVSPVKLMAALRRDGDKPNPQYWSDILRKKKPSFAAKKAREVEEGLGMPPLYLEGGGWPFEDVDQARFDRLRTLQKGRVEQALIDILDVIEAEQSRKLNGDEA